MEKTCMNCGTEITKEYCEDYPEACEHWTPEKPQTNADRIKAMSDEELAEWIKNGISSDACDYCEFNIDYCDGSPCRGKSDAETIVKWLRQPVGDLET